MFTRTHCPVCATGLAAGFEAATSTGPMTVRPCPGCRCLVKSPFFDAEELGRIYAAYALHEQHYELPPGEVEAIEAKVRRLERFAGRPGRLLEIGCGRGHLLSAALRRGWDAQGVELGGAEHLLPGLRDRVRMIQSERDYAALETGAYDVLCSYQVFEHLLDPVAAFREWARALRPGGLLVVDTPNAESLGARMHGGRWIQNMRPEHFVLFSRRALERVYRANGVKVVHRHHGGPPPVCSRGNGSATPSKSRRIFRFRLLSRVARALVHGLGLGDNMELHGRKGL